MRGYTVYAGCLTEKGMAVLLARAKAAALVQEKGEGKKGGRPRIGALGDGGGGVWIDCGVCVL